MISLASWFGWVIAAAASLAAGCAVAGLSAGAWSTRGGAGVLWSCYGPPMAAGLARCLTYRRLPGLTASCLK